MRLWVENAPKLETNYREEIVKCIDQYLKSNDDSEKTATLVNLQSNKDS